MRILIAYDGSISADTAIEDLQRAGLPQQAEALVVCVDGGLPSAGETDPMETDSEGSRRSELVNAEKLAEKASKSIRSYFPDWTIFLEALWGSPAKGILDASGQWHPDLLVVGSHGRSHIARLFLGSVSLELIHKARCSVRVARARSSGADSGPIRMIICNDGSPSSEAVIRALTTRSWPQKTEAQIISAVQTLVPGATVLEASAYAQEPAYSVIREADERERVRLRHVAEDSANFLRRAGLVVTSAVVDADPREAILSAAEAFQADAIFVGARGLGPMDRLLLGSVSTQVVLHAHCTVEVVRQAALEDSSAGEGRD
jgi:nucleotide-binding universal stress UspA family protein